MAPQDHACSDAEKLDMICSYMRNEFCWGISDFIEALARRKAASATAAHEESEILQSFANQVNVESILKTQSAEESSLESVPSANTRPDSRGIVDQLGTSLDLLPTSCHNDSQTPTFKYMPIGLEGPAFRLLRLVKGKDGPIQGQLFESGLALRVDYTALSYTWGGESRPCEIIINGSKMVVTKNAYLALRDLRYQKKDRNVWIDALCIDQNNKEERGHQVQQMGSIYSKAERVIIWLGEATYGTDFAMHHMKQLEDGLKHASDNKKISDIWSRMVHSLRVDHRDFLIEGLQSLLRRDWFKRVWIIQETAKARDAEIVCGNNSVSAGIFAHMPSLLGMVPEPHCQHILDVMPGPLRKTSWWAEKQDLHTLLIKFCKSKATEPRDSIYALLGISSDACDTHLLKTSYENDLEDVIFNTTSFLLNFEELKAPARRFFDWTLLEFLENLNSLANDVFKHAINAELVLVVELLMVRDDVNVNEILSYQSSELEVEACFDRSPLSWAAEKGHETVVKLLLEKGAELETEDSSHGRTPLLWAVENGHEAVVKLLLEKGAKLETPDFDGRTSLSRAVEHGHEVVVKLLLEKGAWLDPYSCRKPLSWAAEKGHETVVKLLLEKGDKLEANDIGGRTPLSWAAEKGHEAVVKLLLEKGANLEAMDFDGRTPLSWAAEKGHEAVVKLLLGAFKGTEPEAKDYGGRTSLSRAVEKGHQTVMGLLGEAFGAGRLTTVDSSPGRKPLSWAAEKGHEAVVKLLLEKGAWLEAKDSYSGRTPLSWAAENGHETVVKSLLEKGAKLEAKDSRSGRTPLSWAAKNGHETVVKLLLENDAKLEAKDSYYGRTPLLWAVENGHETVVKLLLEKGAKPEAKDFDGWTPLSSAADDGHETVMKFMTQNSLTDFE